VDWQVSPLGVSHRTIACLVKAGRTVVGVVTRMRVRKGVDEFIRAIGRLRYTRPDVHGVIVGEVDLDDDLKALVESLGLRDHLSLLGRRNDMPEVMASFDVFVLCSHDEGMSNAILEAMATGLPVVATRVGGNPELVSEGETGLLVPPADPESMAEAIRRYFDDREMARRHGVAGRRAVESRFSMDAMVNGYLRVYDTVLNGRKNARPHFTGGALQSRV